MITINIDLGAATEAEALVLFDHNLTSAATITLIGIDPPLFTEAVPWAEEKIVHYLSVATTKRYWQLQITDAGNPDGYIEIGKKFLGPYLELTQHYIEGYKRKVKLLHDKKESQYGKRHQRFFNKQNEFAYEFKAVPGSDVTSLEELIDAITDRSSGRFDPIFYNEDSAYPGKTWLVDVYELPIDHETLDKFSMPLQLQEVVKSV